MTIGGVTLGPVGVLGWLVLVYWMWRLRTLRYGWATLIPAVTLELLSFVIRKPELLSDILFWVSLAIIMWLLMTGDRGGGGPKRGRRREEPVKPETSDWSGTAVPAT